MKKAIHISLSALVLSLVFSSCSDEDEVPQSPSSLQGMFIVNEGAFGAGNAGISFYPENGDPHYADLYSAVNSQPLGDVAQSMRIVNDKAYIVVNNSQKVVVVDMKDFKKTGVINGLSSPRYLLSGNNSKAYISDWVSNEVKVVDLNSLSIIGSIKTGNGPEQMLISGNKLLVANVGGFTNDSTLTIINTDADTVIATLPCGVNPNSLVADTYGRIWVLCGGSIGPDFTPNTSDDIAGSMVVYSASTLSEINRYTLAQGEHPLRLTYYQQNLYYLGGESSYTGRIFKADVNNTVFAPIALTQREFYGFGINPLNGDLYGGLVNFSSNSRFLHYSPGGQLIDSAETGIAPNMFLFN